jgi:uridine kinase
MRAALLISGYLRTFSLNLPNLKAKILDQFEEVDVYIHITKNGDKEDKYLNINSNTDIENIIYQINPISIIIEDNTHLSDNPQINNTLNLWFKYFKLNQIKKENEKVKGKYDIVIKYRPDLNISSNNIFTEDLTKDIIYLPLDTKIDKSKLFHKNDKYICDVFAFGNSNIMNLYFDLYNNIEFLIKKYNSYISETVLYNYFEHFNLNYKQLPIDYNIILSQCNIFAIAGDSGSGKTTLGKILKNYFSSSFMLECDRYHKWERKDDNWNKYTHLNPEANYLTKMSEDIFDLKIGKTVYQVDYDHSTGKFTEPEKIDSSDNIIVCGLHSLYSKDENIYDIKIFIDTDDTLKYTWKINRDIEKRGHTKEFVLNQIENRKDDYIKYILPQRDNSDFIINFFTDEKFDLENLNRNYNIKLKLLIHKKFNIINILNKLIKENISYTFSETDRFNQIIFSEYKKHNLPFNNNNYYDYILFILFNLNN